MKHGIYADMSEADYFSSTALSSTGARHILDSPARFRYWADNPQPARAAFDLGTAAHTKILGVGANTIIYPDEHLTPSGNASTKAATVAWEAEQRAAGLTPITAGDAQRVDAMAEAVLADPDARRVLESIEGREVSIITEADGVQIRARFDLYDGTRGADLKTARNASPAAFNRSVGAYGYHIQAAWYEDAHKAETGRPLQSFHFLVVESNPPHLVGVYELDFMWMESAAAKTKRARDIYRQCVNRNEWPGYGKATLVAPTWAVYEDEETEMNV